MRAGCNRGLVNRECYIQFTNFLVRVVIKGGLYLRAGNIIGFMVYKMVLTVVKQLSSFEMVVGLLVESQSRRLQRFPKSGGKKEIV